MKIEHQGTDTLNVSIDGRMDINSSPAIQTEIIQNLNGITRIVIDLSALEYLSSSGLRTFLALKKLMNSRGGALEVLNIPVSIKKIFDISGFSEMLGLQ